MSDNRKSTCHRFDKYVAKGLLLGSPATTRFASNTHGPDGLLNKSPGQPPRLNDARGRPFAAMIESGPIPAIHAVFRGRVVDL
jgi:hypothetical protein